MEKLARNRPKKRADSYTKEFTTAGMNINRTKADGNILRSQKMGVHGLPSL